MKCVHPRVVYDGEFPSEYPCGKCKACRRSRTREWANRITHELTYWKESCFITLTYEDNPKSLNKKHLQDFIKRIRKQLAPREIKYFGCGEYGSKYDRPHYHLILLGVSVKDKIFQESPKNTVHGKKLYYMPQWYYGYVDVGLVNYKSAAYVAGYIQSKLTITKYEGITPPFQVQSQGIGKKYVEENEKNLIKNLGFTVNGAKSSLPRYYRKVLAEKITQEELNKKTEEKIDELDEFLLATNRTTLDDRIEYKSAIRKQKENEIEAQDTIRNDRKF